MDYIRILLIRLRVDGDKVCISLMTRWISIGFSNFSFLDFISLGALGDSFYEYLLKAWIQSNKTDSTARQMYDNAMNGVVKNMIQRSPGGLIYASDMKLGQLDHKMGHLACFAGEDYFLYRFICKIIYLFQIATISFFWLGGLFALGAATQNDGNTIEYMNIGKGITNTCHESYIRTPTKLGPEAFRCVNHIKFVLGNWKKKWFNKKYFAILGFLEVQRRSQHHGKINTIFYGQKYSKAILYCGV